MLRRAVLAVGLVCGCGRVGFDGLGGGSDGPLDPDSAGLGDAATDGPPGGCTLGGSTFPGGPPCRDWEASTAFINAGVTESGGIFTVRPSANSAGAGARCTRNNVPVGATGVALEISAVLAGDTSVTGLALSAPGADTIRFVVRDGTLAGEIVGASSISGGYDPVDTRWLRIRVGGGQARFDGGPDGATWSPVGLLSADVAAEYSVAILAETPGAEPAPGTAVFETVRHCE